MVSIPLMTYYSANGQWEIGWGLCQFWLSIDYLMSNGWFCVYTIYFEIFSVGSKSFAHQFRSLFFYYETANIQAKENDAKSADCHLFCVHYFIGFMASVDYRVSTWILSCLI
jgi:hypothetical protein